MAKFEFSSDYRFDLDLSTEGEKGQRMPVQEYSRGRIKVVQEQGQATTAVVEVKKCFDPHRLDTPESYSTAKTLDLTGAEAIELDLTGVPYITMDCTTGESGVSIKAIVYLEVGS